MLYKNILVAVDYSNDASKVFDRALQLAKMNSAGLRVLHIVEPVDVTGPYDLAPILPLELPLLRQPKIT